MCGIAGILNLKRDRAASDEMATMLPIMLDRLAHRGPDGWGTHVTDEVALGHRRLAIIDLSEAAQQPLSNRDGTTWVTVNGEIYNYRDLTRDLQSRGYEFKSQCDSETVVHGYDEHGIDFVEHCNGMWALGLWDERRKRLVVSRDRMGVKPLYYTTVNDYFLFASEPKALLPFLPRPVRYNEEYLWKLLHWHLDEPALSPYEGIASLPPATVATIAAGEPLQLHQFWQLDTQPREQQPSRSVATREFLDLFTDAVRLRMQSDAGRSYFLSGGLDSSAVVGVASRLGDTDVKTISSVFTDSGFDEREYIDELVTRFRVSSTTISPEPNGSLLDQLAKIVHHLDSPTSHQGTVLWWSLFRTAREQNASSVVLTGNGGDEVFGGYHTYYRQHLNSLMRDATTSGRRADIRRFFDEATSLRHHLQRNYVYNWALQNAPANLLPQVRELRTRLETCIDNPKNVAQPLLRPDLVSALRAAHNGPPQADLIEEQVRLGLTRTILPALLRCEDTLGMAWGVEARQPFLDYRVVEYVVALDYRLRTKGVRNKLQLRALRKLLPRSVRGRVDKMGLPTPMVRWLRTTERATCRDFLYESARRHSDLFDDAGVTTLFDQHVAGQVDASKKLCLFLSTSLWLDKLGDMNRERSFFAADGRASQTA
ncbi:MAG: asparagine synthase (glutamine-hydrolyzing) [Planctomycetota bacterium]